jgi:molecular chaperone GrpE
MNEPKHPRIKEKKHKSLQTEVEALKKEINSWENKYLRALADYQNLEKRVAEQLLNRERKANTNFVIKFLEVLDDIEKGEFFVKDPGLKLIKDKYIKILEGEGVVEINVLGKPFDPHIAECVTIVPGKKDNIVVEVIRKGYQLNGKVLRVARVKVEKKKL